MKWILSILILTCSFLFTQFSVAGTLDTEKSAIFDLNRASPGAMAKHHLGTRTVSGSIQIAKAKYDIAVQGGGTGTKDLVGEDGKPVILPDKAVIVDCLIDVLTPGATSASGTVALTAQSAGDLKGTTAAASYTGRVACVPVGTAATAIKLTANRTLTYTIATGPLTNGKFWVYVYYILGGE